VLRILGTNYEAGSGQKLNLQKTSFFFSRNTSQEKRKDILKLSSLTEANLNMYNTPRSQLTQIIFDSNGKMTHFAPIMTPCFNCIDNL
jgi:hypothetical protein